MPTITSLAKGQQFYDALPNGDQFILRFMNGLLITMAWASEGPEVKSYRWYEGGFTDQSLHPQFRYVSGKTLAYAHHDGKQLSLVFTDGHELRSDFRRVPEPVAVDVKIQLPPVGATGLAWN